jgi:hypothetical protein
MRQQQKFITTLSLIVALSGLSPVMAADAGRPSGGEKFQPDSRPIESPLGYKLSPEQMDKLYGGMINQDIPPPAPPYGSDGRGVTCRHIACAGL